MEKAINRVFNFLQSKNIKHTRFEKEIGLSNGYLNTQLKRSANLGEEVLNKIINNCLDLNPTWLLTGKGNMLIEVSTNTSLENVDYSDPDKQILQEYIKDLKERIEELKEYKAENKELRKKLEKTEQKLNTAEKFIAQHSPTEYDKYRSKIA